MKTGADLPRVFSVFPLEKAGDLRSDSLFLA